eukprot:16432202-Heterocapsa_arctica.AAC.1
MAFPSLHVVQQYVFSCWGRCRNGTPKLFAAVPEYAIDGSWGAMDVPQGVANANGFELLFVEEPAQPILAVQNGSVGT